MTSRQPIALTDFKLTERGDALFDTWTSNAQELADLGEFTLALQLDPGRAPDEHMVELVNELREFMSNNTSTIINIIYRFYKYALANDPAWVLECGVPKGVSKLTIMEHLLPERELTVSKHEQFRPPYRATINFTPRWDEEHGLRISIVENKIVSINGSTTLYAKIMKE